MYELLIGAKRSYILNFIIEPTCSCPHFSNQPKVSHTCKHLVVGLTLLGFSNTIGDGNILTKLKYTKKEQKMVARKMKNFKMKEVNFIEVKEKYKESLIPKKEDLQSIKEIPFIDCKSTLGSFFSYFEAKQEVLTNYECSWMAIVCPDGRRKCPGQSHGPKDRIPKGTISLMCDFLSFKKNMFREGFDLHRERRFFCANYDCISKYSNKTITKFSNLKSASFSVIDYSSLDDATKQMLKNRFPEFKFE